MIALIVAATAAIVLGLFFAGWYGSHQVFHPSKMLKMEIWPDRYGLKYETVKFTTEDGFNLVGWLIPSQQATDKTILCCHGWGDNKGDLLERIHFLSGKFNLFLFDSRSHGESYGKITTLGAHESRDVEAAFQFLKTTRPAWAAHLGGLGLSMGASIVLCSAVRHPEFKALLLEAPFASFNEIIHRWSPEIPTLLLWATLRVISLRLGVDPEPFSPVHQLAQLSPRPIFFISGELDRPMPPEMVKSLYDQAREPKEYWCVPQAAHGKCAATAGAVYEQRVNAFFDKHL